MKKVYIASPFFNEKQLERVVTVEHLLTNVGIPYFSPRSIQFFKEDGTLDGEKIFENDVKELSNADVVIALIDDRDIGTTFEIGYAHALNKKIMLVQDKNAPLYKTNVMLACAGPIINYEDILAEYEGVNKHYIYIKGEDLE